jgi:MFS family permease
LRIKWVAFLIAVMVLMAIMSWGVDFVFRDPVIIKNRLSTTYTQMGILLGVLSAVAVIIYGPFGRLSDMYGRRKFIISWIFLSVIFASYAFFAYSLLSLYVIGLARTLLYYLGSIAIFAWVADEVPAKNRGKVLSILSMGSMVGTVVGPVFLGALDDAFGGLNMALIVGSAIALASAIPLIFLPEPSGFEPQAGKSGGLRSFRSIVRDAPLLILSVSSLMVYAIGAMMEFMIMPFLRIYYGLSLAEVGGLIMLMGGFTAIGFISTGFLLDKWVGMRKRVVVSFLAFCGIFLLVAPFMLARSLLILMVTLPIQGFILGVLFPAFLVLITDYSPKREVGTELGAFNSISTLGFTVGNILAGYLWDTGYEAYGAFGGLFFSLWGCAAFAFIPIPLIMGMCSVCVHSHPTDNV